MAASPADHGRLARFKLLDKLGGEPVAESQRQPVAQTDSTGLTQHDYGRVIDDTSKATFRVVGKKLETDAPVEKVTIKTGEVREGVFVADKAMAEAVDPFTWKPTGYAGRGYFVRIKYVIRPQGDLALRAVGEAIPESEWLSVAALSEHIDKITQPFKTTISVVIVDRVSDIPGQANSTDVAGGARTQDRIYLILNGLAAGDPHVALFHEMLHFGLRRSLSKPE